MRASREWMWNMINSSRNQRSSVLRIPDTNPPRFETVSGVTVGHTLDTYRQPYVKIQNPDRRPTTHCVSKERPTEPK